MSKGLCLTFYLSLQREFNQKNIEQHNKVRPKKEWDKKEIENYCLFLEEAEKLVECWQITLVKRISLAVALY